MTDERHVADPGLRRRPFVAPHRRKSSGALLMQSLLGAVMLVALPVGLAWWVHSSPRFLVSEVELRGVGEVSSEWILDQLRVLEGRHLLSLPLAAVERRLVQHAWIEGVDVRRQLPNRLVVGVVERDPVILLRRDEGLYYVDRHGVVIDEYDPSGPVDLPLLSISEGADLDVNEVLQVAADVSRGEPEWAGAVSELEALGAGDYRVYLASLLFPIFVSAGSVEPQVRSLSRYLPQIAGTFDRLDAVDLRFSNRIVIQPHGALQTQEG